MTKTIYLIFNTEQTPIKYLYGHKYAAYNKQILGNFPSQDIFPDNSLTFSKIPDISLTAVKFPDISRFSKQVFTLNVRFYVQNAPNSISAGALLQTPLVELTMLLQ